jgi:hypothetical protein
LEADPELKGGWDELVVRTGFNKEKPVATLVWPSWRLEICTFELPQHYIEDEAWHIRTSDTTYDINGKCVTRAHIKDKTHDWDMHPRAYVSDVIDQFLDGLWTPPWRCGFCRDRISGKVKPNW